MAYELRRPIFDLSGSLAASVASTDAQITGAGSLFTGLPTDLSTGLYLPLVLANDGLGKSEVVWATGHASASPTLTVARGREGSSPVAFDAGDVVRCSPTLRDVVAGYASRAQLPADPHIGMRALLLDEQLVIERTLAGWNDSAPLQAASKRKHHWQQTAGIINQARVGLLTTGISSAQVGTAGDIATFTAGKLRLNRPGHWALAAAMFSGSNTNRTQGVELRWPNGAFPFGQSLYQINGAFGNDNSLQNAFWSGYVNAAQAVIDIEFYVTASITLSGCQYDVTAEYLGA